MNNEKKFINLLRMYISGNFYKLFCILNIRECIMRNILGGDMVVKIK